MEACVACSDSMMRPLPDNVVDDVVSYLLWIIAQKYVKVYNKSGTFETNCLTLCC